MKKLLVPTDFSPAANNAARYSLYLAEGLKEGVTLCNAMLVPIEAPGAAQIAWPLEDYASIKKNTTHQLQREAKKLAAIVKEDSEFFSDGFCPEIDYMSEVGSVTSVIGNILSEHSISMVVMGLSGAGSLERFFIGSNTRDVIAKATYPVLLIPRNYEFKPIKKIAFASDLNMGDIGVVHSLAGFAKAMDAEIQINHITNSKYEENGYQYKADVFMGELCRRVIYQHISYHYINNLDVDHGLDWLHEHSMVDMLVTVHRPHGFLHNLFSGSHTQKLARHVTLPLLVFPPDYGAAI